MGMTKLTIERLYNRDLYRLIKEYQHAGNLNKKCVRKLRINYLLGYLFTFAFQLTVLNGFFLLNIWSAIIAALISFWGAIYNIKCYYTSLVLPLTRGYQIEGRFYKKVRVSMSKQVHRIDYCFELNKIRYKGYFLPYYDEWKTIEVGPVEIFIFEDGKYHAPFIPRLIENYCLDQKRVEEILNNKN